MELFEENEINDENYSGIDYINEIRTRVNKMKRSKYRTTNFSIIDYFVKNNFHPLNKRNLITNLLNDYKASPNSFISQVNSLIKTENDFKRSILMYIKYNNSFYEGPGKDHISIKLENAYYYLVSVFNKYVTNSIDLRTPYKLNKIKKQKIINNIYSIKKEIIELDNSDEDEKKLSFSPKINTNNNKYNNNNSHRNISKIKQEQYDNCSLGNNSIISLDNTSISKSEDVKKIPEIFITRLINESAISSLSKNDILGVLDSTYKYISNKENLENHSMFKDQFKNIFNSLNNLLEQKNSYEKVYNNLNSLHAHIFNIWKLMKNQISSIYLSINTNNYCYDLYVKIREIIYKAEEIYKNNILKIKFNMNELDKIEKKSKEESKIILKALTFIKVFIHSDINFNQLYKLFTEQLNIKERFQLNDDDFTQEDEYDLDLVDKVGKIVKKLFDEKRKIMEEIKLIDKNIGNIMIF